MRSQFDVDGGANDDVALSARLDQLFLNVRCRLLGRPEGRQDVGIESSFHSRTQAHSSSLRMSSIHALIPASPPGNGPRMPICFANGSGLSRDGRMTVRPSSMTKSIRSPATTPRRFRISKGIVTCPLELRELEYLCFPMILYQYSLQ